MAKPSPNIANRVKAMRDMAESAKERGLHFIYIRIPEHLLPFDRCDKYEDPLGTALADARLGQVVGGGQQLGEGKTIEYCGVDVELTDRVRGLNFLQRELERIGAPAGTVIEEFLPEFLEHPL